MSNNNSPSDHCPLCHEVVDVFAVGPCDHPVCFRCSTRMRALCDQLYCAICRSNLPKVIFTEKRRQFNSTQTNSFLVFRKLNIYFENRALQDRFFELLEHRCKFCPDVKPFRAFTVLQNHMRREHNVNFCDLCLDNVKVFPSERKAYDRKKLAEHRRQGDEDDKSHKGHPLCQFCDVRFFDNDELVLHLRKQHYFCHFCEADGVTNEFFDSYIYLQEHFMEEHYLCQEGDCAHTEFTNAFRSDIDLRAHRASEHSKNLKKAAAKQARRIDIDFSYSGGPSEYPSRGGRGGRGRGRGGSSHDRHNRGVVTGEDYEEIQQDRKSLRQQRQEQREELQAAQAISATLVEVQSKGHVNIVDPALLQPITAAAAGPKPDKDAKFQRRSEDFPSLDGNVNDHDQLQGKAGGMAKQLALANRFSVQEGSMGDQEFPTLDGGGKRPSGFRPPRKANVKTAWSGPVAAPVVRTQVNQQPRPAPQQARPAPLQPRPAPQVPQPMPQPTSATPTWRAISATSAAPRNPPPPKQVPRKQVVNTTSLNDFPSLSSVGNHLSNSNPGSADNSPALKKKEMQRKPEQKRPAAYTVEEEFVFPKKTAPRVEVKNKKKKKKESHDQSVEASKENTENNRSKESSADHSKPPSSESLKVATVSIGKKAVSTESKKSSESKNSISSESINKKAVSTESKKSGESKNSISNESISKKAMSTESKKSSESTSPRTTPVTVNGETTKPSDNPKLKRDKENFTQEDFPSLGQPKRKPPGFGLKFGDDPLSSRNQNNMQTSWGADKAVESAAPKENNNSALELRLGDISSMLASSSSSAAPPPPGFNSKPKASPPPGFQSIPPGFSAPAVSHTYSQPINFQSRNQKLIENIRAMTCDADFQEFRSSSGDFRKDLLGAKDYLAQCVQVLGSDNFQKIIVELLVLLPDIEKQQELLKVYQQHLQSKSKRKKWGGDLVFKPCAQCLQVLCPADFNQHLTEHDTNADFPALS